MAVLFCKYTRNHSILKTDEFYVCKFYLNKAVKKMLEIIGLSRCCFFPQNNYYKGINKHN